MQPLKLSAVFLHVAPVPPLWRILTVVFGVPARPDHPRRRRHQLVDEPGEVVDVDGVLAKCHDVVRVAEDQQSVRAMEKYSPNKNAYVSYLLCC